MNAARPGLRGADLAPSDTALAAAAVRRRRTKPVEVRRADLMEAAQRLFVSKGIAATSIEDIAAAAHVAKGTFYLYFPSKEAMLEALQQRFIQGFLEKLEQAVNRCRADDWNARLRAWVRTGFDTYLDQVEVHDVVFHDLSPQIRRRMHDNPAVRQLAELLRGGAAAGAWQVEDPACTAVMLFHALHGLVDDAVSRGDVTGRRGRLARILAGFCLRALAPPPGPAA